MLKTALTQLEMEIGRGDVMEAKIRALESAERDRIERGGEGLGVQLLKGVLDEQRGRAGAGLEMEGLKLKLNHTETEL
jgi:hypothetical protein